MKVSLDSKGNLKVTPETGVECYALRAWFEKWNKDEGSRPTLQIAAVEDVADPEPQGGVKLA